jgi:RNA polymerase sigma-70 factor (ECF subfamily)
LRGFGPFDGAELQDAAVVLSFAEASASQKRRDSYESHRHRVFALAFYMTGGEMEAEELLGNTFVRAFQQGDEPTGEQVDKSLVTELKDFVEFEPVAPVAEAPIAVPAGINLAEQRNVKRPDLEAALVHLPATERMVFLLRDVEGYPVDRVANTLEIAPQAVNIALLRARLKLREVLASSAPQQQDMPVAV